MKYSIILPCYNEAENLMDLVNIINKFQRNIKQSLFW